MPLPHRPAARAELAGAHQDAGGVDRTRAGGVGLGVVPHHQHLRRRAAQVGQGHLEEVGRRLAEAPGRLPRGVFEEGDERPGIERGAVGRLPPAAALEGEQPGPLHQPAEGGVELDVPADLAAVPHQHVVGSTRPGIVSGETCSQLGAEQEVAALGRVLLEEAQGGDHRREDGFDRDLDAGGAQLAADRLGGPGVDVGQEPDLDAILAQPAERRGCARDGLAGGDQRAVDVEEHGPYRGGRRQRHGAGSRGADGGCVTGRPPGHARGTSWPGCGTAPIAPRAGPPRRGRAPPRSGRRPGSLGGDRSRRRAGRQAGRG